MRIGSPVMIVVSALFVSVSCTTCRNLQCGEPPKSIGSIERLDPAFDDLVPRDARIEVLADGFDWSEGPVWDRRHNYLLFSDIPRNMIVQWSPTTGIRTFRDRSGYTGSQTFGGREPGTNGLAFDSDGRLIMCCHGDRAIRRLEKDGSLTTLVGSFEGRRLNSPNDLVFRSDGALFFTDPPYGLPGGLDGPNGQLGFCGVFFRSPDGKVRLVTKEMTRPNGIGLSPDEKTLYVAQSDPKAALWKAFPLLKDGRVGPSRTVRDVTEWVESRPGLPDGMAVDAGGHLWATGPGGVLVMTPTGKRLGVIRTGQRTANCAFGGDGRTLFITADMYLCRVRTNVFGLGWPGK